MVGVQELRTFHDFCCPRATVCGDRARRSALAVAPCEFVLVSANPLRRLCVSKRSRCGAVQFSCSRIGLLEVVSWFARLLSQSRGRGFDSPLVRGRERVPAAPAGKSQLLSTDVVCGACSRSSGWKIAAFKYKRSTRSTPPQLRLENRNFYVQT